jgi:hypothetical protein
MVVLQTNGTTGFIDLATFKEIDAFMYGGIIAVTYFVRGVQKGNWFTYIPTQLRHTQTFDFGIQRASALINRNGDYVCEGWLSILLPQVSLGVIDPTTGAVANTFLDASIRWTRNLMHNLVEKVQLNFNELVVQEQDSSWFDINAAFRLPESKMVGYRNMIGDVAAWTSPVGPGMALGASRYLTLPIPFSSRILDAQSRSQHFHITTCASTTTSERWQTPWLFIREPLQLVGRVVRGQGQQATSLRW